MSVLQKNAKYVQKYFTQKYQKSADIWETYTQYFGHIICYLLTDKFLENNCFLIVIQSMKLIMISYKDVNV